MNNTRRKHNKHMKNTVSKGKAAAAQSKKGFFLRLASDVVIAAAIIGVFYLFLEILPQHRQLRQLTESATAVAAAETEGAGGESEEAAEISFDGTEELEESFLAAEAASGQTETGTAAQPAEIELAENAEASSAVAEVSGADAAADITGLTLRERFAEYFTEEPEINSTSYTSPDISVQISEVHDTEHGSKPFNAYIADIHVASVDHLQTGFPNGHRTAPAEVIAEDNQAVLAVNGDFFRKINNGLIVRNGTVLQDSEGTADICVLYQDGSMRTYAPGDYSCKEILNQQPYQVWSFGPELLDEDGAPKEEFNTSSYIYKLHPRTAIGYYEPGHYCLVVIDGRSMGDSNGATLRVLASVMADLGCSAAYNLDGGGSSTMVFNNTVVNCPSDSGRKISDIVMICELPEPAPESEQEAETVSDAAEIEAEGEMKS